MKPLTRGDIDRFLAHPDPGRPLVIVYGPDAGLVAERAAAIAARAAGEHADRLQQTRLDGDDLAADPLRLAEEAHAISLFGGRRIIRLRVGARNLAPALEPLTRDPPTEATVVLEAGDLKRSSPLLALLEKSPHAALVPCYADEIGDLRRLVDEMTRDAGRQIAPDARDALLALLGGDRLASRREIEKLLLYVGERARILIEDVETAVGDASATAATEAVDHAFAGDPAAMRSALAKLAGEGVRPDAILAGALAHAWLLADGVRRLEAGQSQAAAAKDLARYFRRQPMLERHLSLWRRQALTGVVAGLGEAVLAVRRQPELAAAHAERAMIRIALAARKASP